MRKIQGKITGIVSDISGKADISGQTFTGDIEAPKITASTGILFGTDTAAANTLNDYEEGTWQPSFNGYSNTFTGTYTKIGNIVTCKIDHEIALPTGSIVGDVIITGIPYTANRTTYINNFAHIRAASLGAANRPWGILSNTSLGLFTDESFGSTDLFQPSHANWDASIITQTGFTTVFIRWEFTYTT